ncbi:MAG TPA: glycosyltransferase family 1 protein [Vicinamibacteria bacterium]|nr:glycosyltransferase family 1 protein [Vicinamibacteria bacterium]
MIVGLEATVLREPLSGVGHYIARLIDSIANGAGEGAVDRLMVLSNRTLAIEPGGRVEAHDRPSIRARPFWMQFVLPRILQRARPDLVHFTNYLAPIGLELPFVTSFHDMSLALLPQCHTLKKRLLTARLIPFAARNARLILTPSESTRRDVVRLLHVDPARVRVIPYAAARSFRPVAAGRERLEQAYGIRSPYLLFVGTVEPRKNLARALRAFARIAGSHPGLRFVMVGPLGWKFDEILREVERPALEGRVQRVGYVPEADLPALYSHALAFLYPSLYEGFGLPLVEAMACGAPVITSNGSSMAEIGDGAALLVDPQDEQAIADALDRLVTDAALRAELRERGLLRAAQYSWERTGRETVAAYQAACNGGC